MEQVKKIGLVTVSSDLPVVTSSEMKEIERKANEAGISYYQMMENAGRAAAECILEKQDVQEKRVIVFCGKGNNGGDGFVVARKLKEKGADVKLILMEGEPKTEDAMENCRICCTMDIPMLELQELKDIDLIENGDIIVDAVYGTGFRGELGELVRKAARLINDSRAVTYALDIPSGLNGDNCIADKDTIRADETIVFHRLKPAHADPGSGAYCGRIVCVSIGIEKVL